MENLGHQGMGCLDMLKESLDLPSAKHNAKNRLLIRTNRLDFALERDIEHLTIEKDNGIECLPLR